MDIDWSEVRITEKLWALCTIRFDSIFHSRTCTNGHLFYNSHLFLANSPYTVFCLNLSKTVTFFCPQGGRCGEVLAKSFPSGQFVSGHVVRAK